MPPNSNIRLAPKKVHAGDKSQEHCKQCQYKFPAGTPLAGKQCLRDASCNIGCNRYCYQHATMSVKSAGGNVRSICKDSRSVRQRRIRDPIFFGRGFQGDGANRSAAKTTKIATLLNEGKIKYAAANKGKGYSLLGRTFQRSGRGINAGESRR